MKVLVCRNKHCRNFRSEETLKELKNYDVEYLHSSCMDMCDTGPNAFTFPDLKMYKHLTTERIKDLLNGNAEDLLYQDEIYNLEENEVYGNLPIHIRTVKLFRWHLDKYDDLSVANLREIISIFKKKYDIKGFRFDYPIKIALINTIKGPDLPKVIHFLGKETTMGLLDSHMRRNPEKN